VNIHANNDERALFGNGGGVSGQLRVTTKFRKAAPPAMIRDQAEVVVTLLSAEVDNSPGLG
jgi:hypothetical protein